MNKPWPFNDGLKLFHDSASDLSIPGVLHHDKICELKADYIGAGEIFVRLSGESISKKIHKIWCRLEGEEENFQDVQEHDLAIVVFPYTSGLGTSLANLFDKLLEESTKVQSHQVTDLLESHSKKMCQLCQKIVPPGKDVGTLLNNKSGKLLCSTINSNSGIFHVFHVSCLVLWILYREFEIYGDEQLDPMFCADCSIISPSGDEKEACDLIRKITSYQLKMLKGRHNWFVSPEISNRSTIGLGFSDHGQQQDSQVLPFKRVRFYRAHLSGA